MGFVESVEKRRTIYSLNKDLPVTKEAVVETVERVTKAIPDAFNMRSQRVVVVTGDNQEKLWDAVYAAFEGQVPKEKIDSFKAAFGTILYYTDEAVVKSLQEQYALYANNFPVWASQANGMLQIDIWTALFEMGVGASLQHYNPVIDEAVAKLLNLPASWKLVAQMPFGGIGAPANAKPGEDIGERVLVK